MSTISYVWSCVRIVRMKDVWFVKGLREGRWRFISQHQTHNDAIAARDDAARALRSD